MASLANIVAHSIGRVPGSPAKYLSVKNGKVGIFQGSLPENDLKVSLSQTGKFFSLHTLPVGIVDHALGLVGSGGLKSFQDLTNPQGEITIQGEPAYWSTFTKGGQSPLGRPTDDILGFEASNNGVWVLSPASTPGDFVVNWWDRKCSPFCPPRRVMLHRY